MMKYSILDENDDDNNSNNNNVDDNNSNSNNDRDSRNDAIDKKESSYQQKDSDNIGILSNDNIVTIQNDTWKQKILSFPGGIVVGVILCSLILLAQRPKYMIDNNSNNVKYFNSITNIAFGSCTAYDLREMNIWTDAIIPTLPQAWIWAGDMVYLDDPNLNCHETDPKQISSLSWQQGCNCTATWLSSPPSSCHAGDLEYAKKRWLEAMGNAQYNQFLDYICPNARVQGIFPPPGNDPELCKGPIFGVYDDHDFGWNNGNKRLPDADSYKELYLDAIGESKSSPRRGTSRGLWGKETLNKGMKDAEIDVFLLDERYERDTISCDSRSDYCKYAVLKDNENLYSSSEKAFCQDFLYDEDYNEHKGSCCDKDEKIFYGWCKLESSKKSVYYREACDVSYELFGQRALILDENGDLKQPDDIDYLDMFQTSPFCEVLGREQRKWLRKAVKDSTAAVKLFVSSSVLLENPSKRKCAINKDNGEDIECYCGGDNLDCYRVAQQELLYIITQENVNGCSIVITGDYHYSDIKALNPGDHLYSSYYNSKDNPKPIYQIMASGMSVSTGQNFTCDDYRLDPLGLRTHPECDFVRGPSFGLIEFDVTYDKKGFFDAFRPADSPEPPNSVIPGPTDGPPPKKQIKSMKINNIHLRIMDGSIGNKIRLETIIDKNTCHQLNT